MELVTNQPLELKPRKFCNTNQHKKSVLENDIFGYQSVFTLGNVQFSHKLNFPVYYKVKTPSRKDAFPTKTVAFIKLLLLALVAENA